MRLLSTQARGGAAGVILVSRLPVLCNARAAGVSVLGIISISSRSLPVVVWEARAYKVLGGEGRRLPGRWSWPASIWLHGKGRGNA